MLSFSLYDLPSLRFFCYHSVSGSFLPGQDFVIISGLFQTSHNGQGYVKPIPLYRDGEAWHSRVLCGRSFYVTFERPLQGQRWTDGLSAVSVSAMALFRVYSF